MTNRKGLRGPLCRVMAAGAVMAAIHAAPAFAGATGYTRIAYTQDVASNPFTILPSINNHGDVAFRASLDGEPDMHIGIHVGDGSSPATTVVTAEETHGFGERIIGVVIRDSGRIAFTQSIRTGGPMVYRWNQADGLEQMFPDGMGPFSRGSLTSPGLSDDGRIIFGASNNASSGGTKGSGVFRGTPNSITTVEEIPTHTLQLGAPDSSADGDKIVFRLGEVDGVHDGVYSEVNGERRTIHTTQSSSQFYRDPVINNAGQVAFGRFSNNTTYELLIGDGVSPLETIASITNTAFVDFGHLSLNNHGDVAFLAELSSDVSKGIFLGGDPNNDLLIGIGDALDGSTVLDLVMGRHALNDHGQVTFFARLTDGRQGVYVMAIPSPSGFVVLSGILGCVSAPRRRR